MKGTATEVKPTGCDSAWFYESVGGIDVYCHRAGQPSRYCRIPRQVLEDYVKRALKLSAQRKKSRQLNAAKD